MGPDHCAANGLPADDPRLWRLFAARQTIVAAAAGAPPLPELARRAAMSPFHFLRLFRATFGQTPHQLAIDARLERAKLLLAETDEPVIEICAAVGYESLGTFAALFRREVGLTPRAYRARRRRFWAVGMAFPPRFVPTCFFDLWRAPQKSNFQEDSANVGLVGSSANPITL
jgi:AraC-like DNA-binding protein